jgi:hypothetical protein
MNNDCNISNITCPTIKTTQNLQNQHWTEYRGIKQVPKYDFHKPNKNLLRQLQ